MLVTIILDHVTRFFISAWLSGVWDYSILGTNEIPSDWLFGYTIRACHILNKAGYLHIHIVYFTTHPYYTMQENPTNALTPR